MKGIGWFSGGVTSAVAIKKALDMGIELDIIYMETGSHHPDHERFLAECEKWYGQKILITQNLKYKDHFDLIEREKYINGPTGARCTLKLKKHIRWDIEKYFKYDCQVFGFEYDLKQVKRAKRHKLEYPNSKPIFPLLKAKLNKMKCMELLLDAGIDIPVMYKLGYSNSNCIGCVKGGQGYWNKIRVDFPNHFNRMAVIERKLGNTCIKKTVGKKSYKLYLDELDPQAGRHESIALPECGVTCAVEGFRD